MKTWLVVFPLVIAVPAAAGAQSSAAEDARAAVLACLLGGLCGELAQQEAARPKETIQGVPSRKIQSIGALKAAGARDEAETARENPRLTAPRRQRHIAPRKIPGPGAGLANAGAASIPASVARGTPLFVTFALGSARLTPESMAEVRSFSKALGMLAAAGQDKRFLIEGHTDSTGDAAFNRKLSEERAAAVRAALLEAGIDRDRIEVAGLGADEPLDGYAGENPLNRRVEAVEIK